MTPPPAVVDVVICMGSSCFSRGNNRNIEVIQDFAARPNAGVAICPRGHLCENLCKSGPNLIIARTPLHNADPVTVAGTLTQAINAAQPKEPT